MYRFQDELIFKLGLQPLPAEGGLFRQTYVSRDTFEAGALPVRYGGARQACTAIYYMLTDEEDSFSAFHRLQSDEVYHFYMGDPVELNLLLPDGSSQKTILGQDILGGQQVQWVVERDVWQGLRLRPGGRFALLGTTVAPGFHTDDFELGKRQDLVREYPDAAASIVQLTRR
jgi:predicted cupin superfamily sugar epimerase